MEFAGHSLIVIDQRQNIPISLRGRVLPRDKDWLLDQMGISGVVNFCLPRGVVKMGQGIVQWVTTPDFVSNPLEIGTQLRIHQVEVAVAVGLGCEPVIDPVELRVPPV